MYAWGNNAMGQCGLGHCQSPITSPKKVLALSGVGIRQISAGTSHSVAWTTAAVDRLNRLLKILQFTAEDVFVL